MANNPYVNKVVYGGTTLIDITDTTATAADVLEGKYFYDKSGAKVEGTNAGGGAVVITEVPDSHGGTIVEITSDTVISLQTKTVNPSTSQQVVTPDTGYRGMSAVTVNAMPSGSAETPDTTITVAPSISVDSSGLITALNNGSQNVTPTVTPGYVSAGVAGTISVDGSNTSQLQTEPAQTFHPASNDRTIQSGKYLTGAQTIKGVTVSGLTAANIKKDVIVKIGDSTDDDCITSVTGTYEGRDTSDATATAADIASGKTAYISTGKVTGTLTVIHYYTGTDDPSSSFGNNGDIYLKTS